MKKILILIIFNLFSIGLWGQQSKLITITFFGSYEEVTIVYNANTEIVKKNVELEYDESLGVSAIVEVELPARTNEFIIIHASYKLQVDCGIIKGKYIGVCRLGVCRPEDTIVICQNKNTPMIIY